MRALALLALALCALAGCSGSPPAARLDETVRTMPTEPRLDDTVVLLAETYDYALDRDIPPATMAAPPGGDHLLASFETHADAACTVVAGEPASPLDASVTFTSPSGVASRVEAGGYPCNGPAVTSTMGGSIRLDHEPGEWVVTFKGRGHGASLKLVVTAEPADEAGSTTRT